jgi:hypothetical protein
MFINVAQFRADAFGRDRCKDDKTHVAGPFHILITYSVEPRVKEGSSGKRKRGETESTPPSSGKRRRTAVRVIDATADQQATEVDVAAAAPVAAPLSPPAADHAMEVDLAAAASPAAEQAMEVEVPAPPEVDVATEAAAFDLSGPALFRETNPGWKDVLKWASNKATLAFPPQQQQIVVDKLLEVRQAAMKTSRDENVELKARLQALEARRVLGRRRGTLRRMTRRLGNNVAERGQFAWRPMTEQDAKRLAKGAPSSTDSEKQLLSLVNTKWIQIRYLEGWEEERRKYEQAAMASIGEEEVGTGIKSQYLRTAAIDPGADVFLTGRTAGMEFRIGVHTDAITSAEKRARDAQSLWATLNDRALKETGDPPEALGPAAEEWAAARRGKLAGQRRTHDVAGLFLTSAFDVVLLPKLDVKRLTRRDISISANVTREMLDEAHGRFRDRLVGVLAPRTGTLIINADEHGSTKTCGNCGLRVPNVGSKKVVACPHCKCRECRDAGAARKIWIFHFFSYNIPNKVRSGASAAEPPVPVH